MLRKGTQQRNGERRLKQILDKDRGQKGKRLTKKMKYLKG
jgi:hypothetical protein